MKRFHFGRNYYKNNLHEATRLLVAATRRNQALGWFTEQNDNPDTFHITINEDVHLSDMTTRLLTAVTPRSLEKEWKIGCNNSRVAILLVRYFADADHGAFKMDGEYFPLHVSNELLEQINDRNIAKGWSTDSDTKLEERPNTTFFVPPPICVKDQTQLMLAANHAEVHQVAELLANGANPNAFDRYGRTALMFAVAKDNLEIVETLLKAHANPMIECELHSNTLTTALRLAFDRNAKCKYMLHHYAHHHKPYSPSALEPRHVVNHQDEGANTDFDSSNEDRWENSGDLQYVRRDGGQFGSFPLHEDYSDESRADSPKDNEWYER